MVTIDDIFHHIAQDLRCYSGADRLAAVDEFVTGCSFNLHLSITTNPEETEMDYFDRYGKGNTFYFRLRDYNHGKKLAGQIFFILNGASPDLDPNKESPFNPDDQLYLFLHIKDIKPAGNHRLN